MKARIATMLSLTGVLVAGSAAALVNTQVLRSSAPASNTVSQLVTESSSDEGSTTIEVVTTPAPSSSVTSTSVAADDVKVYEVQNTGRISLDKSKDVLRIVSIDPIAPWQLLSKRQVDALTTEVRFVNGDAVVVFTANLMFDEITTNVTMATLATGSTTGGSTSNTGGSPAPSVTSSNTTGGSTVTTVDDDDDKTSTSVDDNGGGHGGGKGGGGDDDDQPSDDD